MRLGLVHYLVCPECRGDLELTGTETNGHIEAGQLACAGCHRSYPIVAGIPRMIVTEQEQRGAAETFGFEWEHHATGELEGTTVFGRTAEQDRAMFLEALDIAPSDLAGRVVLDGGCGSGQLTSEVGRMGAAAVIGVDVNTAVERPYRRTREFPNIHIVQADLRKLPFRSGTFDVVWSNGVIHHMPRPEEGFASLARVVRSGGRLYVWVYERRWNPFRFVHDVLRKANIDRWPLKSILFTAKAFSYPSFVLNVIVRLLWVMLGRPGGSRAARVTRLRSIKELELTWFDAISPVYDFRYTEQEIVGWFERAGFTIAHLYSFAVGVCGVKVESRQEQRVS